MWDLVPNARRQAVLMDDFTVITSGANGLSSFATGTATAVVAGTTTATNQVGIANLYLGTDTGGFCGFQTGLAAITLTGGLIRFSTEVSFSAVSDATNTYAFRFGLNDVASGVAGTTNFVGFEYAYGSSSQKWRGLTKQTSGTTTVVGALVAATTVYHLGVDIEPDASAVRFFVNGTLIGTSTTNIPASTQNLGLVISMVKTAGATGQTAYVDYIKFVKEFGTDR